MALVGFFRGHRVWAKEASAFVDDELSPVARVRFETHVTGCARCRATIEALRDTKSLVARLPAAMPTRSFALSPEMVARQEPVGRVQPRPEAAPWALRGAQFATGLAVLALVGIGVADFSQNASGSSEKSTTSLAAPAEANAARDSAAGSAPESGKSIGSAPATAASSPPSAGVVAPTPGTLGGQSLPCGVAASPLSSDGSPQAAVPPQPCPSPVPQAPSAGGAPNTAPTTSAGGSGPGDTTFSAPGGSAPVAHDASSVGTTTGTNWYRSGELAAGGIAVVFALVAGYLAVRARNRG